MKILIFLSILVFTHIHTLNCDIVVAGGTLASLGAVIHAPDQYSVCLVEPTERVGGQMG